MVEVAGDPCVNMSHEEIKAHLCEIADRHIAARASYRNIRKDAATELDVVMTEEEGMNLSVITMKGIGLAIEDCRAFNNAEVFCQNVKLLDPILTCRKLDDNLGGNSYAMYQHVKTPMIVSNRCNFLGVHQIELENGGYIHLSTSKGMQQIEQANTTLIGKDVLGHCLMTYAKFEPCEDGIKVTACYAIDPAGSLPDFIKNKIATENTKAPEKMIAHLRKQKGLK